MMSQGILYLLMVAVLFSFGGTWAKLIGPFFAAEYITFFRFLFGVGFLLLLKYCRKKKPSYDLKAALKQCGGWLVFGGIAKVLAYLTENYGILHGASYGVILPQPAQTVFLTCISAFLLKEKLSAKKALFIVPCIVGVMLVSWNGKSLQEFTGASLPLTAIFLLSGVCAGAHVLAQKKVSDKMDIVDSNLLMFTVSLVISALPTIPSTLSGALNGVRPDLPCLFAMLMFGFNTGIGFYLNAKAIPLVPFYMVPIIQSTMAIFAILWGVLFFHEPITLWIVLGAAIFIGGILGIQLSGNEKKAKAA